jgi:hypothetical protein
MNTEVEKVQKIVDGFDDTPEGDPNKRVIVGSILKFTNEAAWEINAGEEWSPDREVVGINILRTTAKWCDGKPDTRVLEPAEPWPDVEAQNEATPQSEWIEGPDGKPRGPWQNQYVVHLLDPKTMDRYTYPTGTTGGGICVRDFIERVQWMRKFRGERVFPIVRLSDVHMNTRFGGRQRPHFEIVRWVSLDGGGAALPAAGIPAIEAPSAKEATNDQIPF